MKKQWIVLLGVVAISFFGACKKKAGPVIMRGNWEVSQYLEDGDDDTHDFSGYVFDFRSKNRVEVTTPAGVVTGTWDEFYDDSRDRMKVMLSFPHEPLAELNEDWVVTDRSRREVRFVDDSDSDEILVLRKR